MRKFLRKWLGIQDIDETLNYYSARFGTSETNLIDDFNRLNTMERDLQILISYANGQQPNFGPKNGVRRGVGPYNLAPRALEIAGEVEQAMAKALRPRRNRKKKKRR